MAYDFMDVSSAMGKLTDKQRKELQAKLAWNKAAQDKFDTFNKQKLAFDKLDAAQKNKITTSRNVKKSTAPDAFKPTRAIDDVSTIARPEELKNNIDPYVFKDETEQWNIEKQKKNNAIYWANTESWLNDSPSVDTTTLDNLPAFWWCGKDEDPIACQNRKLKFELSSVSNRAVDEVKNQKLQISTFQDLINKNADMWANKTKLNWENLLTQKAANDAAWATVQNQFDSNQVEQKAALDELENEWIKRQAERDNLQRSYYNDVKQVLW